MSFYSCFREVKASKFPIDECNLTECLGKLAWADPIIPESVVNQLTVDDMIARLERGPFVAGNYFRLAYWVHSVDRCCCWR